MLIIDEKHLKIVQDILKKYPYSFYAFGSRVNGKPKKLSDLDLYFTADIPYNIRDHLDADFEESDLPYKVDIINWNTCSDTFKKEISKNTICIQQHS